MTDWWEAVSKEQEIAAALDRPVVVYGVGTCGILVADTLRDRGFSPLCFLDRNAQPGQHVRGLEVLHPDRTGATISNPETTTVVLGLFNNSRSSHLPAVVSALEQLGYSSIISYENFHQVFKPQKADPFWLAGSDHYQPLTEQMLQCSEVWADEKSRSIFEAQMRHRLGCGHEVLPEPDWDCPQYLPQDVPLLPSPYDFVDVGAFDGDTIEEFIHYGVSFRSILAFEPDLSNYEALVQRIGRLGVVAQQACFLPVGLGESCHSARFESQAIATSRISSEGTGDIPVLALDQSFLGFKPNYIKLDVEGAEENALLGMRRTVERHRPMLAVSVYHHPQDLLLLPLLIASWDLGASLYLRMHRAHCFDTVMYVIPES